MQCVNYNTQNKEAASQGRLGCYVYRKGSVGQDGRYLCGRGGLDVDGDDDAIVDLYAAEQLAQPTIGFGGVQGGQAIPEDRRGFGHCLALQALLGQAVPGILNACDLTSNLCLGCVQGGQAAPFRNRFIVCSRRPRYLSRAALATARLAA